MNAARLRGRHAPIVIHHGSADAFDYSECSAYYLFSPFGAKTVGKVLAKIQDDRAGRPVRIAYANPAYHETFARQPWLEPYEFWDREARSTEHSVAFYRNRT